RELDIAASVIRSWKRFAEAGAATAVQAQEGVVPASHFGTPTPRSGNLSALGRKTMEVEILRAAQAVGKKRRRCAESPGGGRSSGDRHLRGPRHRAAHRVLRGPGRPGGRQRRVADGTILQQIQAVTNSRATYGYRRVWAMVNRTFRTGYNRKRIRRVMQLHGLMLAPRVHRRYGRPHLGQIRQPASNQRWCSDVFLIPCWSGDVVSVAFAIDCHDRD